MIRRGDPVTEWAHEHDAPLLDDAWAASAAQERLLLFVPRGESFGCALPFGLPSPMSPLWDLAVAAAHSAGTDYPLGMLVHHNVHLGWHKDRQAPPDTLNITVMLRDGPGSDLLVVGDTAWRMRHRTWVCFDNQEWHGVAHYTVDTYRLAVTYYVNKTVMP